MPTSLAKLAANRKNAQRSSGPKTPEGKRRVARNALKAHHIDFAHLLDIQELLAEVDLLTQELKPKTDEQHVAIIALAAPTVQLRAINNLEAEQYRFQNPYLLTKLAIIANKLERDLFAARQLYRSLLRKNS